MIAPMLGMIMLDRKVPNCCTRTRAPPRDSDVVVVVVAMLVTSEGSVPVVSRVTSEQQYTTQPGPLPSIRARFLAR